MSRLKRMMLGSLTRAAGVRSPVLSSHPFHYEDFLPPHHPQIQWASHRFLDIYQMGNKEAIEKERARLSDEMSRGYFADMSELKKHGGKIAKANKTVIPAMAAVKFPALEANFSDGRSLKLPNVSEQNDRNMGKMANPRVSLLCLSFRATSQAMIESWSLPFLNAFSASQDLQLYEVSLIESWFLSLGLIKRLLLRTMREPDGIRKECALQRQFAYSFGDHYYFRKELKILNLLTGYIFLLDEYGRIRWQGFGMATEEELSSLISCTSQLLGEK